MIPDNREPAKLDTGEILDASGNGLSRDREIGIVEIALPDFGLVVFAAADYSLPPFCLLAAVRGCLSLISLI